MSDVVERTLSVLPGLLGQHDPGVGPGGAGGPGRVSATSRLGSLIRSITALTSKHVRAAGGAPPPPPPGRAGPGRGSRSSRRLEAGGRGPGFPPLPSRPPPASPRLPSVRWGAVRCPALWAPGAAAGRRPLPSAGGRGLAELRGPAINPVGRPVCGRRAARRGRARPPGIAARA